MKWIFIFITWFELAEPTNQEIPKKDETECRQMESRILEAWKDAPEEYGFITDCQPRQF